MIDYRHYERPETGPSRYFEWGQLDMTISAEATYGFNLDTVYDPHVETLSTDVQDEFPILANISLMTYPEVVAYYNCHRNGQFVTNERGSAVYTLSGKVARIKLSLLSPSNDFKNVDNDALTVDSEKIEDSVDQSNKVISFKTSAISLAVKTLKEAQAYYSKDKTVKSEFHQRMLLRSFGIGQLALYGIAEAAIQDFEIIPTSIVGLVALSFLSKARKSKKEAGKYTITDDKFHSYDNIAELIGRDLTTSFVIEEFLKNRS